MPEIYEPEEDSYLISEVLRKEIPKILKINSRLKVLEIGCGSGINLQTIKEAGVNKKNILGSDINNIAVRHCINLGFNCIKSDLFNKIPKQKFDLIIFNPPYLPMDKNEAESSRTATTGGKMGNEIAIRFLKQAGNYLAENGEIFLITSSLSENVNFIRLGYKPKEISYEKLFFEKLSVWELIKL